MVFAFELILQFGSDIRIGDFGLFNSGCELFIQSFGGQAELVASCVVVKRKCGVVFDGTLKVIGGDVTAKDALRDLVTREEGSAGKADIARVRQGVAHVHGKRAILRAVRLIRHDNDIVAG